MNGEDLPEESLLNHHFPSSHLYWTNIGIGIEHRHLWSRSTQWSGRNSGPRKWAPKDACVEARIYERPSRQESTCMWCV